MYKINVSKDLHSTEGRMLLEVDFDVESGSFISLVGKSGAGKTTILRMLAGLVKPDKGSIYAESEVWFHKETRKNISPQERSIGFVFQDFALFPNMTVRENLQCVQSIKDESAINELLSLTNLTSLSHCKPDALSGGQKQRVAIARALVRKPKLLLLDEPFSALDHETRIRLQQEILKIHKEYGLTTILVSHDLTEVLRLSDFIVELGQGKILRKGRTTSFFTNEGKNDSFRMIGQIADMFEEEKMYYANIITCNMLVKVGLNIGIYKTLKPGDRVVMSLDRFNPSVQKIEI